MHLLHNGVMQYAWGSTDAIPRFLGIEPDGAPAAELWIGTHGMNPSQVLLPDGATKALTDVAGDLPYLVKVLAAERPLSLQVHPSRSLADAGFRREEDAGIPVDAPDRTYRDRNAKSEMIYALSPFEALIGFRPTAEVLRVLTPLRTQLTDRLVKDLRADPGYAGLVRRLEWLLAADIKPEQVTEVVESCRALADRGLDVRRAYTTAEDISRRYPDDVGVLVTLLMNRVTLQPGEAAFLETGVLHAYLQGLGLEVMVSSDNVLRAGLTDKHIDRSGLVACLQGGRSQLSRVTPDIVDAQTEVFSPRNGEFALAVTHVSHTAPDMVRLTGTVGSLVVCTSGEVELLDELGGTMKFSRGQSVYLGPENGAVQASGLGELAQVFASSNRETELR